MKFKRFINEEVIFESEEQYLLLEMTRKEILSKVDDKFINHKKNARELPTKNNFGVRYDSVRKINIDGNKYIEVTFKAKSATNPEPTIYKQKLLLVDLLPLLKDKESKLTLREKVMKAVQEGDIKVHCSCQAFLFYGYSFITTKLGIAHDKYLEDRPPDIKNKLQRGIVCKHAAWSLKNLPFVVSDITKELKELGYK
jgi:hypothetical protein